MTEEELEKLTSEKLEDRKVSLRLMLKDLEDDIDYCSDELKKIYTEEDLRISRKREKEQEELEKKKEERKMKTVTKPEDMRAEILKELQDVIHWLRIVRFFGGVVRCVDSALSEARNYCDNGMYNRRVGCEYYYETEAEYIFRDAPSVKKNISLWKNNNKKSIIFLFILCNRLYSEIYKNWKIADFEDALKAFECNNYMGLVMDEKFNDFDKIKYWCPYSDFDKFLIKFRHRVVNETDEKVIGKIYKETKHWIDLSREHENFDGYESLRETYIGSQEKMNKIIGDV